MTGGRLLVCVLATTTTVISVSHILQVDTDTYLVQQTPKENNQLVVGVRQIHYGTIIIYTVQH